MKAFITRDSSSSDESLLPPSFIAAHHEDPFQTRGSSIVYPDARRNILMDINNAENTVLPLPSDKDTLKVFLRVKPRTEEETKLSKEGGYTENEIVNLESEHQIALTAPKESKAYKNSINGVGKMTHRYTFTQIFDSTIRQKEIFSLVVLPRLQDCLEGQNQLLFTYGATSSGKTYTIQVSAKERRKVKSDIPLRPIGYNRVIGASDKDLERTNKLKEDVFKLGLNLIKRKRSPVSSINSSQLSQASGTSAVSGMSLDSLDGSELYNLFPALNNRNRNSTKLSVKDEAIVYTVWISFAEIYNECVFDLLEKIPEAKKKGEKVRRHVLKLSEDKDGSTFIKDITEIQVSSADEAYQAMMIGRENLQFAATKLNHQSSRSHCIFTIKIIRVADTNNPQFARVSMLSFCDLAGSERVSKTQTVGTRQKEAGNINTSLLVLGRCIKAIRSNQACIDVKKHQMIPFRESKLTRLIKNYFTGLGKASLVVCVSQAPYLFDESIHVMKFASIATKVTVEQFKAPAPQPAARRTTRFSSILAKGGKQSFGQSLLSGRGSIAWEPSSRSTMIPDFTNGLVPPSFAPSSRSTICPQINITEVDEEDESDVQDETICESAQYHALLDLVEDLKLKLIEERKKNKTLERNIREQLCDEFNEMLVEIEEMHTGRLERERENMKERSEWRIQQLQLAYKNKGNKRKRVGDSGEEFDGNEMKIASLENQVSEKCKEFENLNNQLQEAGSVEQALKDTLKASNEVKDKLQEQNSSLQFQLADQQRLAAEIGRELLATKNRLHEDQKLNMDKLESEESQISELKIQVTNLMNSMAAKEDECQDMKELLQEAGDEFLEKQEEIKKLENAVTVVNTEYMFSYFLLPHKSYADIDIYIRPPF
ncbi:kinesin-like protein KIF20A [Eurytemora carolleeae]|uniref:kinesin-like protein KIF20A n=1 Tax=Eurytemora carolleeae TaxID=1294199 RepID=UPI000C76E5FC|nr:kinesin-like protein KIF20A [Eurytemora carolleeae]|eukprot:XP_023341937.1 kinesin-like protein KIF20A [Eurytemora affinis]